MNRLVAFIALALLPIGTWARTERTGPTIVHWASEPVDPGQTALLYGAGLEGASLLVARLADGSAESGPSGEGVLDPKGELCQVQGSDGCGRILLPAALKPGIFELRIADGRSCWRLNLPRPSWFQPRTLLPDLRRGEAAPGSSIQVVGRNFLLAKSRADQLRVVLRGADRKRVPLAVETAEPYSLVVRIPEDTPPGEYELWVHNGFGGPAGWGGPLPLRVRQPLQWPTREWNIREFGAKGDNVSDDSGAVRKAFETATRAGGGVIYFPAGTYRLSGWFLLPRKTRLRGDGKDLTWLKWPLTEPHKIEDFETSALYGAGEYALEDLSIVVRNAKFALVDLSWFAGPEFSAPPNKPWPVPQELWPSIPPLGTERDIFLRRARILYEPFCGRPGNDPAQTTQSPQWRLGEWGIIDITASGVFAFCLQDCHNVEVSDCEIMGSGRLLDLMGARITRSRFSDPTGYPWADMGGQNLVVEANDFSCTTGFRPQIIPMRNLYVAHNETCVIQRGEREALAWEIDGPMGRVAPKQPPWLGQVREIAGATDVPLSGPPLPAHAYKGMEVLILSGRGAMQYRVIADNAEHSIQVTEPWAVAPDASSLVLLHELNGHFIWYANHARDATSLGEMWAYGTYDVTFDSNKAERTQGMWGLSGFLVQWLQNQLIYAVTYQEGVGPNALPAYRTPEGGASYGLLGMLAWNVWGTYSEPRSPYAEGLVMRENLLEYGHRIQVIAGYGAGRLEFGFPYVKNVVIEGNQIEHSPVGIEWDTNVYGGIVRNNRFVDVAEPFRNPEESHLDRVEDRASR